ncbi:hypothetical protein BKA62DRAFT_832486 [Auriculariales sp. MPI-PUGE-AT-0066]|nr:hypothetical protein BKA62DRAFT_832486 [Auriculariales sp. MPI-PUGE-AT-0066]
MSSSTGQGHAYSSSVNHNKAQLATAYNELGKELSSQKVRVVGNYTLGKVIGEGTYGKVRLGTHRLTSTRVAIKQIPKALSAQLTREIHHHRRLHHPHVTQLFEVIATESYIWLVTELCAGGELFDYLVEKGRLSEDEARRIFGQLCLAVGYVHEQGVVHRDLKLENVLLDERCRVKLGDFGFTREFERGNLLDTYCGTTGYAAPEMLQGRRYTGQEVDVWSLGIIFYALLTGSLPFDDDDEDVMRDKIIKGEYEDVEWLTDEARDLVRGILVKEPTKRLTIAQILGHKWFTDPSTPPPPPAASLPGTPSVTSRPGSMTMPFSTSRPASVGSKPGSRPASVTRPSFGSRPPSWDQNTPGQHQHQHQPTLEPTPESIGSGSAFSHASSTFSAEVADVNDLDLGLEGTEATTPDDSLASLSHADHSHTTSLGRTPSETTLVRAHRQSLPQAQQFDALPEEEDIEVDDEYTGGMADVSFDSDDDELGRRQEREQALARLTSPITTRHAHSNSNASAGSAGMVGGGGRSGPTPPPSMYPTRTPVRTKRRSVSSTLSLDSTAPAPEVGDARATNFASVIQPSAARVAPKIDFSALLSVRAPVLFSTPAERELLNSLAALGLDTGQLVHSVLSDACDASGAVWWMLRRKTDERRVREAEDERLRKAEDAMRRAREQAQEEQREKDAEREKARRKRSHSHSAAAYQATTKRPPPVSAGGIFSDSAANASLPELALVPPTPLATSFGSTPATATVTVTACDLPPITPPKTEKDQARLSLIAAVAELRMSESGSSRTASPTLLPPIETSSALSYSSSALNTPPLGALSPSPNLTPTTTKPRSSSVSMIQRGLSSLAAGVGVVKKKSDERVRMSGESASALGHSKSVGHAHGPGGTLSPAAAYLRERVVSSPGEPGFSPGSPVLVPGTPMSSGGFTPSSISGLPLPSPGPSPLGLDIALAQNLTRSRAFDEPKTPNRKLTKSPPVPKHTRSDQGHAALAHSNDSNGSIGMVSSAHSHPMWTSGALLGSPSASLTGHGGAPSVASKETAGGASGFSRASSHEGHDQRTLRPSAAQSLGITLNTSSLEAGSRSTVMSTKDGHLQTPSSAGGVSNASTAGNASSTGSGRGSRASILGAFTRWFQATGNEERKGKKRKPPPMPPVPASPEYQQSPLNYPYPNQFSPQFISPERPPSRRAGSSSGSRGGSAGGGRPKKRGKRASVGSHRSGMSGRSSSVNSRQSSRSRVDLTTPLSAGPGGSGYPLSLIRSYSGGDVLGTPLESPDGAVFQLGSASRPPMHSKNPSASSIGSGGAGRHPSGMNAAALAALRQTGAASPLQKYHARVGSSGSGSTRVVRNKKSHPHPTHPTTRMGHTRTGSAASSSAASSRRGSWMHERERAESRGDIYDEPASASPSQAVSDAEGPPRPSSSASYNTGLFETPRRGTHTQFVQRRSGLYGTPSQTGHSSVGRNSWKKSWGREPPGWSSRGAFTTHAAVPFEVISLDYPGSAGPVTPNVRDVFSAGGSKIVEAAGGDDSDWVDEDDEDVDAFARGFGQVGPKTGVNANLGNLSSFKRGGVGMLEAPLQAPPRGRNSNAAPNAQMRGSPVMGSMSLPPTASNTQAAMPPVVENLKSEGMPAHAAGGTRRNQLAINSFKDAIVEADEDEEE